MKIKSITNQHRRDFTAIYQCEGCGAEHTGGGYDDDYFHDNVIPEMKCKACGKTGAECGAAYVSQEPKYLAGMQV
jgi:DNA-directed RNA polymerase subunit RPC12/RpoP